MTPARRRGRGSGARGGGRASGRGARRGERGGREGKGRTVRDGGGGRGCRRRSRLGGPRARPLAASPRRPGRGPATVVRGPGGGAGERLPCVGAGRRRGGQGRPGWPAASLARPLASRRRRALTSPRAVRPPLRGPRVPRARGRPWEGAGTRPGHPRPSGPSQAARPGPTARRGPGAVDLFLGLGPALLFHCGGPRGERNTPFYERMTHVLRWHHLHLFASLGRFVMHSCRGRLGRPPPGSRALPGPTGERGGSTLQRFDSRVTRRSSAPQRSVPTLEVPSEKTGRRKRGGGGAKEKNRNLNRSPTGTDNVATSVDRRKLPTTPLESSWGVSRRGSPFA